MSPIIVETKDLNLLETIARKIKGSKVEIVETSEGVLIRSVHDSVLFVRRILRGKTFTTKDLAQMNEDERELER
jgi:hypothetical protein